MNDKMQKHVSCNLCGTRIMANCIDMGDKVKWIVTCPVCGNGRVIIEDKVVKHDEPAHVEPVKTSIFKGRGRKKV